MVTQPHWVYLANGSSTSTCTTTGGGQRSTAAGPTAGEPSSAENQLRQAAMRGCLHSREMAERGS